MGRNTIHFNMIAWSDPRGAETKEALGFRAKGREVVGGNGRFELKESPTAYRGILEFENAVLSPQNQYLWEEIQSIST
jgi:hypothetical protein